MQEHLAGLMHSNSTYYSSAAEQLILSTIRTILSTIRIGPYWFVDAYIG